MILEPGCRATAGEIKRQEIFILKYFPIFVAQ